MAPRAEQIWRHGGRMNKMLNILQTYLFNKLHNLLLGGVAGNKVIKISDNINTDAAGQVVLGGTEGAGHIVK